MVIKFYGAAREVTGSCILVETAGAKILLDCGFFQGSRMAEERNFEKLPFDPQTINCLIVCHAHLDHVGRIPVIYKQGFRGRIYSTAPTKELATLVLLDSYKLMAEEAKRDRTPIFYSEDDITGALELFETVGYEEKLEIRPGVNMTLRNAGHILGSSICVLESNGKKLAYTSDLGNIPSELLEPPAFVEEADYVICESTYGSRVHEDISKRQAKLTEIIIATIAKSGVLMIPSFAIERTQELLHDIEHFCYTSNCAIPTFYLDSPLAQKVTTVFEKYPEYLKPGLSKDHKDGDIFGVKRIKVTSSAKESQEIDSEPNPKIIIAGSGMMNGGRILFHLQKYIEDSNTALLIVGYQANGTLGRRLLDGEKKVKIFGKKYNVNTKVMAIGSYSAHADSPQLLNWLSRVKGAKKIFLVHGEISESEVLAKKVRETLHIDVELPQLAEEFSL
jgi:metallo-beta-lactamase family protein